MKKITAVLLAMIMLISFAACSLKGDGETTTEDPSQTEEANTEGNGLPDTKGEGTESDLLMTLYSDCDSIDYQELTGKTEHISTGYEPKTTAEYFRFVSPKNGVTVRLEAIEWSPIVEAFEATDTVFEIQSEKDKIYEFECFVADSIPSYRIIAEYGELKADYSFAHDGYEVVTKLEMLGDEFIPDEISEYSAFYNLCVARAASKVYYDGFAEHNDPAVVWDTIAYAVTLNQFKMIGEEDFINMIGLNDWEADAYFSALYPTLTESDTKVTEDGNVVAAHFSTGEKYLVMPYLFERFSTNKFYGVEDNGDGTYSVKIRIDDYRFEGYEEFGLAVIVEPDANSPFGYAIKDVVDCELPRG